MFNDITNDGNMWQAIDDEIKTEDVFTDDNYLFDSGDEQETKNLCDFLLSDTDQNDILCEDVAAKVEEVIPIFLLPDKRKNKPKKFFKSITKTKQC